MCVLLSARFINDFMLELFVFQLFFFLLSSFSVQTHTTHKILLRNSKGLDVYPFLIVLKVSVLSACFLLLVRLRPGILAFETQHSNTEQNCCVLCCTILYTARRARRNSLILKKWGKIRRRRRLLLSCQGGKKRRREKKKKFLFVFDSSWVLVR